MMKLNQVFSWDFRALGLLLPRNGAPQTRADPMMFLPVFLLINWPVKNAYYSTYSFKFLDFFSIFCEYEVF